MNKNYYIVTYHGEEHLVISSSYLDVAYLMLKLLTQDTVQELEHCVLEHTFILSNKEDPVKRECFIIVRQIELLI